MGKILITGATGFLGYNLVNKLIKKKIYTILLVRNVSNVKKILKLKKNKYVTIFNFQKKKIDYLFKKKKIEGIIHCATNYGNNNTSDEEIINSNLLFPLNLLKLATKYQVKFFINSDTILNKKISGYALSKCQFNDWLKFYSPKIKCINIKLEHFFGPGDNLTKFVTDLILKFLKPENIINLTPGNQKRDFIYIDDVIEAYIKIFNFSKNNNFTYKEFEVGTGKSIKLKYFVNLLKKITKNKNTLINYGALKYRKNEIMNVKVNLKNLKKLGWKSKTSLKKGLIKTIKFYEKN